MKWRWIWPLWIATTCLAEVRDSTVVYLADLKLPATELTVLQRAPLSMQSNPFTTVAHLPKGQKVSLLGWSEGLCYVAGRAATGPIRGWVATSALAKLPDDVRMELQKRIELREQHRELIARREVAVEMSRDEVLASVGKPDSRQRTRTDEGEQEEWRYVTYRYLPRYYQTYSADGKMRQTVTYRRVPAGHRAIIFRGEYVVAIEENAKERQHQPTGAVATP